MNSAAQSGSRPFVQSAAQPPLPPPAPMRTARWRALCGDAISALVTAALAALLLALVPRALEWAVINGVWTGGGERCGEDGACWAFLSAKFRLIVFGIYPASEQWRPAAVIALFLALALWTLPPAHWHRRTLALWIIGTAVALLLMGGGWFGLSPVPTAAWGGLPITLLLTVLSLGLGFPLAVALALGRRSRWGLWRALSITTIEIVRGLPLLSMLFIASILLPLMLPAGVSVDKLLRALVALTLFASAYIAEVLRAGLQALPPGQAEAAQALGLSRWQMTRLVILPQAIGKVIPPLTNTVVVIVKNTSLVLVVGLFDLLSSGRAALTDPSWPAPYAETYLFIALIYFAICFGIARYSLWLERRLPARSLR